MTATRSGWRRALVALSCGLALWGLMVAATGGIGFRYGPIFFSSRGPRNSLILAALFAAIAWAMAPAGHRSRQAVEDWTWLSRSLLDRGRRLWRHIAGVESWIVERAPASTAPIAAAVLSIAVVAFGFKEGAFVAAGADAWGYLSQADLWLDGSLRLPQPLMRELSAQIPPEMMAPLSYRTSVERTDLVPVLAPGLPMLMALFAVAAGREAVFYVVPLLAGAAIVATYLIGARLNGRWTGVAAAALLAASPSFLFQLTSSPMSDIPATAWWGLSLAAVMGTTRRAALAAGVAAAAAVLTRPNLAPLVCIPGAVLLWRAWRAGALTGPAAHAVALYGAALVPAAAAIAMLNAFWYGSPTAFGYGALDPFYSVDHILPNLARYPRWLLESQTPLILMAAAAPLLVRRRAPAGMLVVWVVAVFACYIAYLPFDAWWFLRFLLPAYPALLALTAAALLTLAARLPRGARLAVAALAIALAARHGIDYARVRGTFLSETEYKYAIAGRYVADHLPERAMLFTMQHSGSVRYYSGRPTLRWDLTPPDKLDWAIAEIERHGYVPYALVEDWEEEMWRQRLTGQDILAALARPPVATLPLGNVRVYDLRPGRNLH